MTLQEVQEVLSTITYREGWKFTYNGYELTSYMPLKKDATNKIVLHEGETFTLMRTCSVSHDMIKDARCFIEIVYNEIIWMEMHELDEWFRVNKECWRDPHAPARVKALEVQSCGLLQPV
jgi:hypothetical protein